MARQSRRSAPARSAPAPARAAAPPQHQQQRSGVPASAAASRGVPAQQQAQHAQVPATVPQSQGPGIFGQIAANAASMAVGSTVARGVSHAMGWNGQAAAPAAEGGASPSDPQTVTSPYGDVQQQSTGFQQDQYQQQQGQQCELFATDFRNCLSATKGDPSPCQYYLDQFRSCQASHAQ